MTLILSEGVQNTCTIKVSRKYYVSTILNVVKPCVNVYIVFYLAVKDEKNVRDSQVNTYIKSLR